LADSLQLAHSSNDYSEDNNDTSVISLGAEDKILPKTDPGSSNGKRQTDADMQSQLLAVRARRSEAWKARFVFFGFFVLLLLDYGKQSNREKCLNNISRYSIEQY
jgi:hypothetical protein